MGTLALAGASAGLTLIEVAVVIFIMGLMLTIAMPYFGGLRRAELKSAARRIAGRATYFYSEASSRKLIIRWIFDMNRNAYRAMVADPYAPQPAFFPDTSSAGAPVFLPPDVRIRDVTVEEMGTYRRGAIACQFYPEGYVDNTLIHLEDSSGDVMTVGIDSLTGSVTIGWGDLTQRELMSQ